jgi:CubicO group peptidase (beta-lactamase class C family)
MQQDRVTDDGYVAPGFEGVRDAFAENMRAEGEVGASFCVQRHGVCIVDLWGGHADTARTRPWSADTLTNVWSTTKGALAASVTRLVADGRLAYQDPVARYWPEFAAAGKAHITVAQLFSHQGGLAGPTRPLTVDALFDVDAVAALLAAEPPQWPVGSQSGYHALSIGYLAEALFRRVTGRSVGEYFARTIAAPLQLDFYLGLADALESRAAETSHDGQPMSGGAEHFNRFQRLAQEHLPIEPLLPNQRRWRAMGLPSAGGFASARGVAGLYAALLSDLAGTTRHVADAKTLHAALRPQISGEDLVLRVPITWGIGFALNADAAFYGPNPRAFGHHGWGGSTGFADPDAGLAVGYAPNFMREAASGDPRAANLVCALYAALDGRA